MLAALNHHVRDTRIRFLSATHTYVVDGRKLDTSVTGFVKKNFKPFDADDAISKMKRFGSFQQKYGSQTIEQVKRGWEENGDRARTLGTRLHAYIESFYNGEELPAAAEITELEVEIGYFYNFLRDHQHLIPYRSEWFIFDEQYQLAGCIDMAYWIGPGKIALYDWKRSKKIENSSRYGKGMGPLAYMDDCNLNHYSLQLNVYRRMIERNYGLEVTEMKLVILHPDNSNYVVISVRKLCAEIDALFAQRAEQLLQCKTS